MRTHEICGVEVTIHGCGRQTVVDVGGEKLTPREIEALAPSADWSRDVQIGRYTFDANGLAYLKRFVRSRGRWTPPADPLLHALPPEENERA